MTLNLDFIVLFLLATAVTLALGYLVARSLLGPQAAQRNLTYAWPWFAIGALLGIALAFAGRYGLTALYALYSVAALLWLVSWPWRKRQSGKRLMRVGKTTQNKLLLFLGMIQTGVASVMTLRLLDQVTDGWVTTGGQVTGIIQIVFWWAIAYLFVLLGLSHLEIRENGLAYLFSWQPWERIQAFGWDDDKPNTLILKVYPRSPFSRKYLTLSIPFEQAERVDQILENYLLEADLDAEMEDESVAQT